MGIRRMQVENIKVLKPSSPDQSDELNTRVTLCDAQTQRIAKVMLVGEDADVAWRLDKAATSFSFDVATCNFLRINGSAGTL